MKRYLLIFFWILFSCQDGKKELKNSSQNNNKTESLIGHTFLKVTQKKSDKILFKPCDANIETFKIYKDSIYHNMGQEYDIITKIKSFNKDQIILFEGFNTNLNKNEVLNFEKIDQFYWKINNELYIDDLYKSKISLIKEVNCDSNEKIEIGTIKYSANGIWSIDCANGIGSMTINGKTSSLIVLSNQIYIEMVETKRYDFEKGIAYKLKEIPDDLGTYGIKLDWKEYVNDKPIAYIKIIDDNTINFYWYGFYNKKTNKREMTECQFNQDSNEKDIVLKKCSE